VGPLALVTPPDRITDPKEMLARSLQAVLDASSVHVDGSLEGRVPGRLVERDDAVVDLGGASLAADLRPRDARSRAHVAVPALAIEIDAVTVWTTAWVRSGDDAWQPLPVSDATAGSGVDVNPLTLVDRLRSYLATSGRTPVAWDTACASPSGRCHEVRLDAGTDPAGILIGMLPGAGSASVSQVTSVVALRTDCKTLRPQSLVVTASSADGSIDLRLTLWFSDWDAPTRIDEPSASPG
jgi:hypothetical protein